MCASVASLLCVHHNLSVAIQVGIVTATSISYSFTVTETKIIVLVTLFLLQRHKKLYRLHSCHYRGIKNVTGYFITITNSI
jgi:hypothetical protein